MPSTTLVAPMLSAGGILPESPWGGKELHFSWEELHTL